MKTRIILTLILLLVNNITCDNALKNSEISKIWGSVSPWNCGCCNPERHSVLRIQYMCCYEIINQTIFASICADSNSMFNVQSGLCLNFCQNSESSNYSKCYEDVTSMPYTCIREGFRPPEINNSLAIGIVSEQPQTSRLPTMPTLQAKLSQMAVHTTPPNPLKSSSNSVSVLLTTSNVLKMTSDKTHSPSETFAGPHEERTKFVSSAGTTKTSLNTISQTKLWELSTKSSEKQAMLPSSDLNTLLTPNIQQFKTTATSDIHISTKSQSFINKQTHAKAPLIIESTKLYMATSTHGAKSKSTSVDELYLNTTTKLPKNTLTDAVKTNDSRIITSSKTPISKAPQNIISITPLTKSLMTIKPPNSLITASEPESKSSAIIALSPDTSTKFPVFTTISDTTIKSTLPSLVLTSPSSPPFKSTELPSITSFSYRVSQPNSTKLLLRVPSANIHASTSAPKRTSTVKTRTLTSVYASRIISSFNESHLTSNALFFLMKQGRTYSSPLVSTTSASLSSSIPLITLQETLKSTNQNQITLSPSTVLANLMHPTSSTANNLTPNVRGITASVSKSDETQNSPQANNVKEEISSLKNTEHDKITTQSLTTIQTISSTAENDYLIVVTGGICGTVVALVALITLIACIVRKKFKCTVLPNSRRFSTAEPFLQDLDLKYRLPRVSIDVPIEESYDSNCRVEETYAA